MSKTGYTGREMVMNKMTLQEILGESFKKYRDHIAIQWGTQELTYGELDGKSDYIAHMIIDRGIKKESFLGIYISNKIDFILAVIGILKAGCVFVPLDPALPPKRIERMIRLTHMRFVFLDPYNKEKLITGDTDIAKTLKTFMLDDSFFAGHEPLMSLRYKVDYHPEDRIYLYFTSGTTGAPKAVMGKNKSLLHFIQWEIHTCGLNHTCRVSQLITPGFDAYLRDLLAPLCAGGRVCIPENKGILLSSPELIDWIDKNRIQLIHCVPSLFNLFNTDTLKVENFKQLKYILLAGEQINPLTLSHWFGTFHERIHLVNLYGATEVTMAKTYYYIRENDVHKDRIPVGKAMKGARVIIFDKDMNPCPRNVIGEIYIRTPYRTYGYYNDPEANSKAFIPNPMNDDPNDLLYKTGDLGKILPDGSIDFLGRVDRQVKIRGMRVELEEIENVMLQYPGTTEAVIVDINDQDGVEYLCAYFVSEEIDISQMREYLSLNLPDYMVPAFVTRLEQMPRTPNGKVDFKTLPPPEVKAGKEYTAPRDEQEKKLVEAWSNVLALEKKLIGIDANFFELGGHSLKVTRMISRIHKSLNVKLNPEDVFRLPTIRGLADYMKEVSSDKYAAIKAAEKKECYRLSPAQNRLYIFQQMNPESIAYNMPKTAVLEGKLNMDRLDHAFRSLIKRHETLRTSFEIIAGEPVQKIHQPAEIDFSFEYYTFTGYDQVQFIIHHLFIRPFKLSSPPLFRVGLMKTGEAEYILMVDIHHIISDGTSNTIIVQNLFSLYEDEELLPLKIQYKDFAEWQSTPEQQEAIKLQEAYWLKMYAGELPVLDLPTDYERPEEKDFKGDVLNFEIGIEEAKALNRIALEEGMTLYMVLLAIYNIFLSKISGQEDIIVGTGLAGRHHEELEGLIGMFVNTLALRNFPRRSLTFREFLKDVKKRTLLAFENQDYQFESLVGKLALNRDMSRNPMFDVVFGLENTAERGNPIQEAKKPELIVMPYDYQKKIAKFDMIFFGIEDREKLFFSIEFNTSLFEDDTIKEFIRYFKKVVSIVLEERDIVLKDLKISNEYSAPKLKTPQVEQGDFGF